MKIPWYDREQGKWVDKEEIDAKKQGQAAQVNEANDEIGKAIVSVTTGPVVTEQPTQELPTQDFTSSLIMKDDDDLPF